MEKNVTCLRATKLKDVIIFFFATILILYAPSISLGHPHVFIDNRLTIIFDKQGLTGFHVKWIFDEFFSNMIALDYDRNKNNTLENSEIAAIKKGAFNNLAKFEYFTFISINGKQFKSTFVRNFSAVLNEGVLTYEFFIPCHVRAISNSKEVVISQYDPTYYCEMLLQGSESITITENSGIAVSYRTGEDPEKAYYFGLIHPVETIVRFRVKDE
jgi:ABC-type uncharacterized transport system substrate-binding protein